MNIKTIGILKHDLAGDAEDRIIFHAKKKGWLALQINPFEIIFPITTDKNIFKRIDAIISRCEIAGAQSRENDQYLRTLEYFERCQIPVINNSQSVINTQDKYRSHVLMALNNIPTPVTFLVHNKEQAYSLIDNELIRFPIILKDPYGSRGTAVYKVHNQVNMYNVFSQCFKNVSVLVQEFLASETDLGGCIGDIRAWVVRNSESEKPKFVGAYHRFARKGDFRTNLSLGGYGKPINEYSSIMIEYSMKMLDVLNADVLGVDMIKTKKGEFYIIEANIAMDTTNEWRILAGDDVWKYVVDLAIARALKKSKKDKQ
jgi:RimK family alpha-L-glutamate ligase